MLRELTEYGNNIKEEMKVTLSEIKKNPQRINSEGKEARIHTNDFAHKEAVNIQQEQNEETRVQENKDRIRSLRDISKCTNIRIIGMPEGEEEEQEIENLFEKNNERRLP